MNYLEQLRRRGGTPQSLPPTSAELTKPGSVSFGVSIDPPPPDSGDLTKLTKPGSVSFADGDPTLCGTPPPAIPMTRARREAISKSWDGDALRVYFEALLLGRLALCGNCAHYAFGEDPAALGYCARFKVEAWPFAPFQCEGFESAANPAAPLFLPDPLAAQALAREYR